MATRADEIEARICSLASRIWKATHPDYRTAPGMESHPGVLLNVDGATVLQPLRKLALDDLRALAQKRGAF